MSNDIDRYLKDLERQLVCRGRARRRLLSECREHLLDLGGTPEAVARFGAPGVLARSYDTEVAAARLRRATATSLAAVAATGGSTLAVIHGAQSGAVGAAPVAAVFFVCAQLSATTMLLGLARVARTWRGVASTSELRTLVLSNLTALLAGLVTMLAAAIALPGQGSPLILLGGPAAAIVALGAVLRSHVLVRGVRRREAAEPAPRGLVPVRTVPLFVLLAAAVAFMWDHGEGASTGGAVGSATVEALAVLTCYLVLGGALGIRAPLGRAPRT